MRKRLKAGKPASVLPDFGRHMKDLQPTASLDPMVFGNRWGVQKETNPVRPDIPVFDLKQAVFG